MPSYRAKNGKIETERLCAVSLVCLKEDSDPADPRELGISLGIAVPEGWPPALMGRLLPAFRQARMAGRPEADNMVWLLLLKGRGCLPDEAVGLCGFLAPPDPDGRMEIRYAVLDDYRGRGLATEGATAIASWAFLSGMARSIFAQVGKNEFAAMRILAKLGFVLVSKGKGETLLFERRYSLV